jgi:hypothetical protein
MSDENENNLVQRGRDDRRTLEKMRRKLATSGQMGKNDVIKLKKNNNKPAKRIWPFAIAIVAVLLGLNYALNTHQDQIVSAIGGQKPVKVPLAPPAGTSLDDQARFWAYAAYDVPKLKARFQIPKGAVVDNVSAYANLEKILADNLGTEVRKEIFTLQQSAPAPVEKRKIHAAASKPI